MPVVNFYKADESLQWLVRRFETIRDDNVVKPLIDRFIPRPDVALVFNFKSAPYLSSPCYMPLKKLFIATVCTRPLQVAINGELDSFIVICNPTVLSRVFRLNMGENDSPLLELPDSVRSSLLDHVGQAESDSDRICLFSDFMMSQISRVYEPDAIDLVCRDIIDNCLWKPLSQITSGKDVSISCLQRNFLKRAGVSMKRLMRIARVHAIYEKMQRQNDFNCRQLLFESNYYDQAHFINDFKAITGLNPNQFFKQNSELCQMISGMARNDSIPA